jgi:hypothetical protein
MSRTMSFRRASLVTAALMACASAACGPGSPEGGGQPPRQSEIREADGSAVGSAEYDVLSAILAKEALGSRRSYFVIRDSTRDAIGGPVSAEEIARELRLPLAVIHEYQRLNERRRPLQDRFTVPRRVHLISSATADSIINARPPRSGRYRESAWATFQRRFHHPSGIVTVSRVAFTESGNTAIASYALICESLCGQGSLVRLDRVKGRWTVSAHAKTWIS